jgi:hypothetical protein
MEILFIEYEVLSFLMSLKQNKQWGKIALKSQFSSDSSAVSLAKAELSPLQNRTGALAWLGGIGGARDEGGREGGTEGGARPVPLFLPSRVWGQQEGC